MRFHTPQTLKDIAEIIQAKYIGVDDFPILGTNELHRVKNGEMAFVNHPKYYDKALNSQATAILIDKEMPCPQGKALLISEDPFRDFNKINTHFIQSQTFESSYVVGENTIIYPSAVIGNSVRIGKNCVIHPNVVIGDRTIIGDNCIIQSGTILGGDAFYYRKTPQGFDKLLSVGDVIIGDEVEIGTNCTIDRGVTDSTIIGKGSKLDNLIQIGHDTVLGKNCLVASQVGIAGCCTIEDEVTIWGQVGIASGVTIGRNAVLLAKTGVNKNLKSGKTYFGIFPYEFKEYLKREAKVNRLIKEV